MDRAEAVALGDKEALRSLQSPRPRRPEHLPEDLAALVRLGDGEAVDERQPHQPDAVDEAVLEGQAGVDEEPRDEGEEEAVRPAGVSQVVLPGVFLAERRLARADEVLSVHLKAAEGAPEDVPRLHCLASRLLGVGFVENVALRPHQFFDPLRPWLLAWKCGLVDADEIFNSGVDSAEVDKLLVLQCWRELECVGTVLIPKGTDRVIG